MPVRSLRGARRASRGRALLPVAAIALAALSLAGCGSSHHVNAAASVPTTTSTPRATLSTSSTPTTTTPTTRATTPTAPAHTTTTATPTVSGPPAGTPVTTGAATPPHTTSTATTPPPSPVTVSCGTIAFAPQSSYLASSITATGSDCQTARAVAGASRPHTYDPPAAGQPVVGYSADGFACAGSVDSHSVLELVDYRCTRGSAVISFQRSA